MSDSVIDPFVSGLRVQGKERVAPTARACVIYARVSKEDQETVPMQLEIARKYAAGLGLPVLREFFEELSGLITTRGAYREMLAVAHSGLVSHVICFSTSRLGREAAEYITAARDFERLGVEFHSTNLGRIDPALAPIHAWMSNMEVRNISNNVLPAMVWRAQNGQDFGTPPYGYRRTLTPGAWEQDKDKVAIVQELFRRYAEGQSLYGVTAWFNGASGQTRRAEGVKRMLANPYYAGVRIFNRRRNSKIDGAYLKPRDQWVYSTHEKGMVDRATFARAQARLEESPNLGSRRPGGPAYPLTGLIICARCERKMHGQPDETGRYPFYHCPYCGKSRSVRRIALTLRGLLRAVPIGPLNVAAALERTAIKNDQAHVTGAVEREARRRKLTASRTRLARLYADAELTPADYHAALGEIDAELAGLLATELAGSGASVGARTAAAIQDGVAWLASLGDWAEVLGDSTAAGLQNAVYRRCFTACVLDVEQETLTVRWTPALAALTGHAEQTAQLPRTQGSRPRRVAPPEAPEG